MCSTTLSKKLVQLKDNRNSQVSASSFVTRTTPNDEIKNHFKVQKQNNERPRILKKVDDCGVDISERSSSTADHFPDLERLREFDLDATFGPCSGISRMERWIRAYSFGFNPPVEVRTLITDHPADKRYTQSVWFGETI